MDEIKIDKDLFTEFKTHLDCSQFGKADATLRKYLSGIDPSYFRTIESDLRKLIDRFPKKRKRDINKLVDRYLMPEKEAAANLTKKELELEKMPNVFELNEQQFEKEIADELSYLSNHQIFQWNMHYREFVGQVFEKLFNAMQAGPKPNLLRIIEKQLNAHAMEIYGKGYEYIRYRVGRDALQKSLNGLQSFLALPIEFYSSVAFRIKNADEARNIRSICSVMLAGIIQGYGNVSLGEQVGWQLLPRFPGAWIYTLAFMKYEDANGIIGNIEGGEVKAGLVTSVLPILHSIDRLLANQTGNEFNLPRLGQFVLQTRRLEVSLSLPQAIAKTRYLEIHCYTNPVFLQRGNLEESTSRAVNLIAAPVRPDLRDWVEANDILRTTFVDTSMDNEVIISNKATDILNHELAKYVGDSRLSEPIKFNLARNFPLQNPFLARYFLVHRNSVRNLFKAFENDTGVRLWCSVRRSGKTTACFDLGSDNPGTLVINQTMEHTEQYNDANIFQLEFSQRLESNSQIPANFFKNTVRSCIKDRDTGGSKLIFVLDEYETLFQRMNLAVRRDRELRYTVVQPLLNQMVGFSKDNLIILIGQRPDSHYILMDQNQLSPYVKQDKFPLFEHSCQDTPSEFTELIRKILTERVEFDTDFVNAVYAETSGHPYLTVNVLSDFFQWLIDKQRRAGELMLIANDFYEFSTERLSNERLRLSGEYDFFRRAILEAGNDETKVHDPWLFAVYKLMQFIVLEYPSTMCCPLDYFLDKATSLASAMGWDVAYLLNTATKANFFIVDKGVKPAIPILARLAAVSRPMYTINEEDYK